MKRSGIIFLITGILLSACQKQSGEGYTLKFYGDAKTDIGYSVAIASDGYLIAGQLDLINRSSVTETSDNIDMAVIKTDWEGNIKWPPVTAGGRYDDYGSKLLQLSDGSMICIGTLTDTISPLKKKQVYAIKLSSTGSVIWKKAYSGGSYNQEGKDIIETGFGFIILGSTDAPNSSGGDYTGNIAGNTDLLVIRIDPNGNFISSDPAGFAGNEEPSAIVKNGEGDFVLLGTTDRAIDQTMQLNNIFLVKLFSNGALGPYRIFGTSLEERPAGLLALNDGYLVAGTTGVLAKEKEAFVEKLPLAIFNDTIGKIFRRDFRINDKPTTVNCIARSPGGNYLLGGCVYADPGLRMTVFEIGSDGLPVEGKLIIKGSSGDQVVNDVVEGDDGYIIAVGSNSSDANSMISFLKFKF